MADRLRAVVSGGAILLIGGALVLAFVAMVPPGQAADYGLRLTDLAVSERQTANAIAAVLFDLRLMDTLGEVFALFAGAAAVQMLLREVSGEHTAEGPEDKVGDRRVADTSDAMRLAAARLVGPAALVGLAIVVRGHISVGGGFQGGVLLASAVLLVYLAGRYRHMVRLTPHEALDAAETVGAGGFAVVAATGLAVAGIFGANLLPTGQLGSMLSGGTVGVLSVLVGVEAAAAVALVIAEYARQALEVEQAQG